MNPAEPILESTRLGPHLQALEHAPRESGLIGLDTGLQLVNELLGGLRQGLYVLVGPPSCGKTSFAKQLADKVAELNKVPVVLISFEQSASELRNRSLSRLGRVNSEDLLKGRTEQEMESYPGGPQIKIWERIEEGAAAYREFAELITMVEGDGNTTLQHIHEIAVAARSRAGTDQVLVVVDALNSMPDPQRGVHSEGGRLEGLCFDLRRLARALDCPVVAVSQQCRATYLDNVRPTMKTFDGLGGLEHVADVAGIFWSNEDVTQGHTRPVSIYFLKNRYGTTAKISFIYQPHIATFFDHERENFAYVDSLSSEAAC